MTIPLYHFGLLGHRITYSQSQLIFEHISREEQVSISFEVVDTPPDRMASALEVVRRFDGFSVTIPFKEQILQYADHLSGTAKQIGAVNSVRVDKHKFHCTNTDWTGFIYPLRKSPIALRSVLLLGHGGAARAVLYGIAQLSPGAAIRVSGRDHVRVSGFAQAMGMQFKGILNLSACLDSDIQDDDSYDMIVNCTPLGGGGADDLSPLTHSFGFAGQPLCYDLIYTPEKTAFLRSAENAGCRIANGQGMLVRQAVASYAFWSGRKIDEERLTEKVLYDLPELTAPPGS